MRVLGLDLGSKRIGLAISDPDASIAFPAGCLRSTGRKADVAAITALIREREVGCVVIGLPRHMDGRKGPEAVAAEAFASALRESTGLPVETLDERWTSVEADRALRSQGLKSRKRRELVDSVAASIILRTYLDLRRNQRARDEAS
jgi:putative Holliday junction resolvase